MQENSKETPVFSKTQLLECKKFSGREKDILSVLLKSEEMYSVGRAEMLIENFMKRGIR